MAETVTTSLGATGYTAYHSHASTTTYDVQSVLRCRVGPGTGYAQIGGAYHQPGSWWTVAERVNGWCRVPSANNWSSGDFMSNPWPSTPTPGEFRISSMSVSVKRENPWDKNITVTYKWNWNNAAGTTENYYHWRVYCYAAKPGGGECQQNIYGDSTSIGSNQSGSKSETFTVEETSGNTSLNLGNYGIWYTSYGGYANPSGGVGSNITINVPKYVAAQKPTTTAISVSNISTTGAKITGTHNNNGSTIDKYTFSYRKVNGTWNDSEVTSNSRTLSGLTPNTKYEYRARAHNAVGWGDYKSGSYFWTKPLANKPTVSCTARGTTTATVVVTKNSTNYPDINLYNLNYKKNASSSWTDKADQSSNSFSLTGLSPNTKYDIRGQARTGTGGDGTTAWSAWSDTVSFYTKPQAGTASASCVRNRDLGKLNIKVNTAGTYTPAANNYQIRYKKNGTTTWTEVTASSNQTQTLSNLSQNTNYDIQVRARTNTGLDGTTVWSAWSSTITVKTVTPGKVTNVDFVTNTTNSVKITVSYTNGYPNENRIYYAIVDSSDTNPRRVDNMFVTCSTSPVTINITKDANGNALVANKNYKVYVLANQYKANADWYTAGLDLNSAIYTEIVSTRPQVGTLTNVKCNQNNTYNSIKLHAEKSGTWTIYEGWQYRYKKSSDTKYSVWSQVTTGDKTVPNLVAGETYNIEIRGSTGPSADSMTYYSQTYTLTVRVAKRPTIELSINSITTNKVKIVARVADKGYPELNSILWSYASNSYITSSYVPNTYVQQSTTSTVATSNVYEFTLYKQAMYNFKIEGRQHKAAADWFVAGIDNKTPFYIKDIELSLYSGRTDRLKAYNGSFKNVDKFYHYSDSKWNYDGQRIDNKNSTNMYQLAYCKDFYNINKRLDWFADKDNTGAHNSYIIENFKTYVPMFDNIRKDISTAYGGNLLPKKLDIDFTKMNVYTDSSLSASIPGLCINTNFDYKISKNSISFKLKNNLSNTLTHNLILYISGLQNYVSFTEADNIYIEYNVNVIPVSGDSNQIGSAYIDYDNYESPSTHCAETIGFNSVDGSKSRFLLCIPVKLCKDFEDRDEYIHTFLGRIRFLNHSNENLCFKILKKGSIINFSNFGFYYMSKKLV